MPWLSSCVQRRKKTAGVIQKAFQGSEDHRGAAECSRLREGSVVAAREDAKGLQIFCRGCRKTAAALRAAFGLRDDVGDAENGRAAASECWQGLGAVGSGRWAAGRSGGQSRGGGQQNSAGAEFFLMRRVQIVGGEFCEDEDAAKGRRGAHENFTKLAGGGWPEVEVLADEEEEEDVTRG